MKAKYDIVVRIAIIIVLLGVLFVLILKLFSRIYIHQLYNLRFGDRRPAFNSNYTAYEGKQTGFQVKSLIKKLIELDGLYEEEPSRFSDYVKYKKGRSIIPSVKYVTSEDDNSNAKDWQESDDGGKATSNLLKNNVEEAYTKALMKLSNGIQAKHTYFVELNIGKSGLVDEIIIYYDGSKEN